MCLKRWKASGADVRVLKKDASTLEGANDLLKSASAIAPVGGIFHLAVVSLDIIYLINTNANHCFTCHSLVQIKMYYCISICNLII